MNKIITTACFVAIMFPASVWGQSDSTQISEVTVTGTRSLADMRHLPSTVTVIERDVLTHGGKEDILSSLDDIVPGFMVTHRSMMGYGVSTGAAGGISVRGLNSSSGQMMVLIDGHPQYSGIYGHAFADCYRTLMAERVEVLRGPASMLYGSQAMGGVLNIVTRQPKNDGVNSYINIGAGSYGTVQTEASTQARYGKFSSTVAAQYGRSDNHRDDMGFEQYGGFVKLGYEFDEHWKADGNIDVAHWNASNPGPEHAPVADNDQHITRTAATFNVSNNYGHTSGGMSVYCSMGRHKINDGYAVNGGKPQTDYFRSKDAMAGISMWQTVKLCSGNRMTAGVDYQCLYGHAYYTDMKTDTVVTAGKRKMQSTDHHLYEIAAYIDFRQELSPWMTLDAGIRCDRHSIAGVEWIPQVGLAYRPCNDSEFKATVGKGFRNPTVRELFLYGTRNSGLSPERLVNYELAWHQRLLSGRLSYGLNLFYAKGDNIIMTVENCNMNSGEIENLGAELEATWRMNRHWSLSTNHSCMHMEHHLAYAPRYKGNLSAAYRCDRWSFSTNIQQLCGLYTVLSGAFAAADSPQEDVTLLSATVEYEACKGMTLWTRGHNLLARRYEYVHGYPMPKATLMAGLKLNL